MRPVPLLSLTPLHTMAEGGIPQRHPGLWGWSTAERTTLDRQHQHLFVTYTQVQGRRALDATKATWGCHSETAKTWGLGEADFVVTRGRGDS